MIHPLADIYRGKYRPVIGSCSANDPYAVQLRAVEKMEAAIKSKLPPELREEFEQFREAMNELGFLEGEGEFTEGFRLGVQLMVIALGRKEAD